MTILLSIICIIFLLHFTTFKNTNVIIGTENYEIKSMDIKYPNQLVVLRTGETIRVNEILTSDNNSASLIRLEYEWKDIFGISVSKYKWILYIPTSISAIA